MNIIDLANLNSCSFIATDDLGIKLNQNEFKINLISSKAASILFNILLLVITISCFYEQPFIFVILTDSVVGRFAFLSSILTTTFFAKFVSDEIVYILIKNNEITRISNRQ